MDYKVSSKGDSVSVLTDGKKSFIMISTTEYEGNPPTIFFFSNMDELRGLGGSDNDVFACEHMNVNDIVNAEDYDGIFLMRVS